MKLNRVKKAAFMKIIELIKLIPYDKLPKEVKDELEKYGIVKEENETMSDYADKIVKYVKEVEKTF